MNPKEIKQILQAMVDAEASELTLETPDYKLTVRRGAPAGEGAPQVVPVPVQPQPAPAAPAPQALPPAPAAQPAAPEAAAAQPEAPAKPEEKGTESECPNCVEITAPIVGTFYRAPAPDAEPFVKEGDRIEKGQVVCIIEAMKLFNEIESEVSGIVRKVLVENAEPVEYGQPLFLIEPA
ncbi:acetyl-CoA carboxylase biotin carboxyl carrier protein [Marinithermus hydrothermalis]|uniref:Biotin carboxyl carrier protein of acetyl-CoA carboxylase n=1 Tax=Marinithermus hydrothermalis (strain DSM 14884 / JCM 11576 / T1) TaxID=869210 RepID=F2NNX8_MARHT|nr:acetyl-CoA carboxylase biotin carboxyl carrier protein [Marinithermus hydrothermalis]AEB11566.1 acetyl-CoA carboxylase, biotin carboxyl carrier protein [Marinithermus hydrothermalis DSM 14884]